MGSGRHLASQRHERSIILAGPSTKSKRLGDKRRLTDLGRPMQRRDAVILAANILRAIVEWRNRREECSCPLSKHCRQVGATRGANNPAAPSRCNVVKGPLA